MNAQQDPPKIEFPCRYPIKVLGEASSDFESEVVAILRRHAPGFSESDVSSRASSKGRFQAVTVFINATGKAQLARIFDDLKRCAAVKMVL